MRSQLRVVVLVVGLAMGLAACSSTYSAAPTSASATNVPATSMPATSKPATSEPATSVPATQASNPGSTAEVTIKGFAFDPPSLTIKVGTTVTWTNQDSAPHTVTSDAGDWDSGQLSQGQSYSHTFTQAGTFTYHCANHSSMTATITVTN